jgi:hypothetical protein
MTHIVVEQSFDSPLTPEAFGQLAARVEPCLEQYGVTWVRSFMAADRRRMICHFEAADAEAVRAAYRSANARFDRAWTAEVRSPEAASAE